MASTKAWAMAVDTISIILSETGWFVIILYGGGALLAAVACLFSILVLKVSQAKRVSKKPTCCYCGSGALHVSSPSGIADRLLTYWNCIPHRCEVCFHRQYRLADPGSNDRMR